MTNKAPFNTVEGPQKASNQNTQPLDQELKLEDGCLADCSNVQLIALMMEAARTSEMLANFYQTICCYNPEDSHLHTHCHKNLKSCLTETRTS
jgi:hypothetical protein